MKPNLSNIVIFILIEQNGSYVIRQNNMERKMLCIQYFLIRRKKLSGRPNTYRLRYLQLRRLWLQLLYMIFVSNNSFGIDNEKLSTIPWIFFLDDSFLRYVLPRWQIAAIGKQFYHDGNLPIIL